jgi:hypothetical protein|tara:strand:+ start:78 stop:179 length:102 start_codon:yes stop_codon:yes gene_type:complete
MTTPTVQNFFEQKAKTGELRFLNGSFLVIAKKK